MRDEIVCKNFKVPRFTSSTKLADSNAEKQKVNTSTKPIEKDKFENSNKKSQTILGKLFKKNKNPKTAENLVLDTLTTLGAFGAGAAAKKGIAFVDLIMSNLPNAKPNKMLHVLNVAIPIATSFIIRPILNGINNLTLEKADWCSPNKCLHTISTVSVCCKCIY